MSATSRRQEHRIASGVGEPDATRYELEWEGIGRVVNMVTLPNGKTDANNQHAAFISTDLPEADRAMKAVAAVLLAESVSVYATVATPPDIVLVMSDDR